LNRWYHPPGVPQSVYDDPYRSPLFCDANRNGDSATNLRDGDVRGVDAWVNENENESNAMRCHAMRCETGGRQETVVWLVSAVVQLVATVVAR
jgi:hypothetical protein